MLGINSKLFVLVTSIHIQMLSYFAALRDLLADVDGNMMAEISHSMQEVHYCRLETQSNVYGLAQFKSSTDENRLLVASVHGKVMSVSFQKTVPSSREVHFTYIPGILCISASVVYTIIYLCHLHDGNCNKMQLEILDFAHSAAVWQTG